MSVEQSGREVSVEEPAVRDRQSSSGERERRSSNDFVLVQPPELHRGSSWSGQDGPRGESFLLTSNNERCMHFLLHQEGQILSSAPDEGKLLTVGVCDKVPLDTEASPTGVMNTALFAAAQ